MIRLWKRLMSKLRRPSVQTMEAQRRLEEVRRDDVKVDRTIARQAEIIRENHLGHMIAALFERNHPHR